MLCHCLTARRISFYMVAVVFILPCLNTQQIHLRKYLLRLTNLLLISLLPHTLVFHPLYSSQITFDIFGEFFH